MREQVTQRATLKQFHHDVRYAVLRHALDRWHDDLAHHASVYLRRDHRRGRVRAHAAGVRSLVAVAQALVILAGGERQYVDAVAHHYEARLLALHELLDHHACARRAEASAGHHRVDRGVGLLAGPQWLLPRTATALRL